MLNNNGIGGISENQDAAAWADNGVPPAAENAAKFLNSEKSQAKERYAKVYTIASGKGGTGKTTICANLGMALSLLGRRVLLIDGDTGLKNLDVIMGLEEYCVHDIVACAAGKVKFASAAVQDPRVSSLFIIAASQSLDKSHLTPKQMGFFCHELMKEFDYILIDAPAGIENGFACAIAPATHALIVTVAEHASLRNADRIAGLMEANGILPKNISIIINKIEAHLIADSLALDPDEMQKSIALPVMAQIPFDYDIIASNFKKRPVVLNGRSLAAKIFVNIARTIDGEKVEPVVVKKYGLLDRILNIFSR